MKKGREIIQRKVQITSKQGSATDKVNTSKPSKTLSHMSASSHALQLARVPIHARQTSNTEKKKKKTLKGCKYTEERKKYKVHVTKRKERVNNRFAICDLTSRHRVGEGGREGRREGGPRKISPGAANFRHIYGSLLSSNLTRFSLGFSSNLTDEGNADVDGGGIIARFDDDFDMPLTRIGYGVAASTEAALEVAPPATLIEVADMDRRSRSSSFFKESFSRRRLRFWTVKMFTSSWVTIFAPFVNGSFLSLA